MCSYASALVGLLLEELPTRDFERRFQACLESARDSIDRVELQPTTELVLQLRQLLDRYKKRSNELAALYETAGDLSSLRDLEMVLAAIVKRARQLLGTHVAYLMLMDTERGDAYMRATAGTVTPAFAAIRLNLGSGLGGLVAQSGSAQWTSNYLQDARHEHVIDAVVHDEQLVAILGVPLKIGSHVVGVLFAADRTPRNFEQDEVSLLLSLGAHAAIAIDNASRFTETQSSLVSLTEAMATIERQNLALERAADMHERLMTLVVGGSDHHVIAATVAQAFDGTVVILGPNLEVLASGTSGLAEAGEARGEDDAVLPISWSDQRLVEVIARARDMGRSTRTEIAGTNCHIAPVVAGDFALGALILVGPILQESGIRALESAATVTALVGLNERTRDELESRLRGELLSDMLTGSASDSEALSRRAALADVDLTAPLSVAAILPVDYAELRRVGEAAGSYAKSHGSLVTTHLGRVVLLVPFQSPEDVGAHVAKHLQKLGLAVTVGVDGPVTDFSEVAVYEARAHRCAKMLRVLGRVGQGATTGELGAFGLLLSDATQAQLRSFIDTTLGKVQRYDETRGTTLVETMEQYFEADASVGRTAEALYLHPNTVYQRLERLDRVLGEGWRMGDRAIEIRLAIKLDKLARM